ncbi:hypothetical protein [Blastococcus sp. TF02A-35]|uniref:hypothetical protein n=1 Tax=Blastococcus sp. TF02A-35 TaxID=2559612 RepID=UPI0010744D1C|nr:hypothetical protein [Blastococcus sp. TF02A_35]TFV45414.1 hypothetical protein E4P43_17805 [Blastococcus sp. TF02A_35]
MSTPSDPQSPAPATGPRQPTTQEIPVVTPPATGATSVQQLPPPSAPVPPAAPAAPGPQVAPAPQQATGPVDFVPGLPGLGTPPPPPAQPTPSWPQTLENEAAPAAAPAKARVPRDRTLLAAAGLVVLSMVALQVGLAREFGTESFWSAVPLWSAFATACVVLGLAAVAELLPGARRLARSGWTVAAAGLVGLAAFWVLVVLPNADTDRGFLHTAALAALGGAVWLTAGRRPA